MTTAAALEKISQETENVKNVMELAIDHGGNLENVKKAVLPMEGSKLCTSLAFSLASCYYVLLKTRGGGTSIHPISEELKKIKGYVSKIKELESRGISPQLKLNKPAAVRFIEAGLDSELKRRKTSAQQQIS